MTGLLLIPLKGIGGVDSMLNLLPIVSRGYL